MNFYQQAKHKNITVHITPRPPRIVFFIEKSEHSSRIFDSLFSYSYSIWGGLRTILVPVIEGEVSKEYIEWIQLFDPDILYTYAKLSDELIQRLAKTTTPFTFKQHSNRVVGHDGVDYTPQDVWGFVESQALIPKMLSDPTCIAFIDKLYFATIGTYRSSNHQFYADNFGFFDFHKLDLIKKQFANLCILWQTASNQKRDNIPKNVDLVLSESEFLEKHFNQIGRSVISMASLSGYDERSQLYLRSLNYEEREYMHANYNIFIGDSFEDRLNFWNSRHNYSERYADPIELSLRISATQIKDEEFIKLLKQFLLDRVFTGGSDGRSSRRLQLFSYSLSEQTLNDFISKLGLKNLAFISNIHPILPILGGERPCKPARPSYSDDTIDKTGQIKICTPNHFDQLKNLTFFKENSTWISDIKLERHSILNPYYSENEFGLLTNFKQSWKLPRNNTAAVPFIEREIESRINYRGDISAVSSNHATRRQH